MLKSISRRIFAPASIRFFLARILLKRNDIWQKHVHWGGDLAAMGMADFGLSAIAGEYLNSCAKVYPKRVGMANVGGSGENS